MKRRLFVALAAVLPLIIFGAAKWIVQTNASWRPVSIGKVKEADSIFEASNRYLTVCSNQTDIDTLFDLETRTQRPLGAEGIIPSGDWMWKLILGRKARIQLRRANGPAKFYNCPNFEADGMKPNFPDWIRVSPEHNRLEALLVNRYYCWDLKSGQLKREVPIAFAAGAVAPLGRDGKMLVMPDNNAVAFISTESGRVMLRVPLVTAQPYQVTQFSNLGTYAICEADNTVAATKPNLVVETRTGRVLWTFNREGWWSTTLFSPDEKLVALPQTERRICELRNAEDGEIVRTLPLVNNTGFSSTFSPDGNTLYSVANGVIYRQRAR